MNNSTSKQQIPGFLFPRFGRPPVPRPMQAKAPPRNESPPSKCAIILVSVFHIIDHNLDPSSDMQWYPKEAIIADLLISRFFQHQFNAAHRIDYDSMLLGDDATSRDIVYLFTF
ncbi:hypothetical protein OUZ56_015098 [Daphnia magna]|uniref:Uncharacterized protein n=1 Tax=Daphnia magna TaxID=35525 RepID=A0ABR0ALS7_9CRUS|nr:hypothetical protein OUZ56_015098 [Daphnia magna]